MQITSMPRQPNCVAIYLSAILLTSAPTKLDSAMSAPRRPHSPFPSRPISATMIAAEREQTMEQSKRTIEWLVWSAILLTVLVIAVAFTRSKLQESDRIDLRPIAQLPEFTLTNQDGRAVSLADWRGEV